MRKGIPLILAVLMTVTLSGCPLFEMFQAQYNWSLEMREYDSEGQFVESRPVNPTVVRPFETEGPVVYQFTATGGDRFDRNSLSVEVEYYFTHPRAADTPVLVRLLDGTKTVPEMVMESADEKSVEVLLIAGMVFAGLGYEVVHLGGHIAYEYLHWRSNQVFEVEVPFGPGVEIALVKIGFKDPKTGRQTEFTQLLSQKPSEWTIDSSGNGLPDWWMDLYPCLDSSRSDGVHSADGDPDRDGLSNYEEFLLGSDPCNPNDPVVQDADPVAQIQTPTHGQRFELDQRVFLEGSISSGTAPFQVSWSVWNIETGQSVEIQNQGNRKASFRPDSPGLWAVAFDAWDDLGRHSYDQVEIIVFQEEVLPPLEANILKPLAGVYEVGQPIGFEAQNQGGGVTYIWTVERAGETLFQTTVRNVSWTPNSAQGGHLTVRLQVQRGSESVENTVAIEVVSPVPALTVSIAGPSTVEVNQQFTMTTQVAGGSSPYSYRWWIGGTELSGQTGAGLQHSVGSPGTTTIKVQVTDSVGTVKEASKTLVVQPKPVDPDPLSVSLTGPSTVEVNQQFTMTTQVAGGVSPYSYRWWIGGTELSGQTGAGLQHSVGSPGTTTIKVQVTDSVGTVKEASKTLVVQPKPVDPGPLSLDISHWPSVLPQNQVFVFTANVTGGKPPYSYRWTVAGFQMSTQTVLEHAHFSAGSVEIGVRVTDANGEVVEAQRTVQFE